MHIMFFDAEGDVVQGRRQPWQFAAELVTPEWESVFAINTLISEGLGQYKSRQRDQDKLVESGLPVMKLADLRAMVHETINAIDSAVVAMAWGSRDFPKLGSEFFPAGVQFANGIETWAADCPADYDAPKTKTGRVGTTLKNVYDFEIGTDFEWHDAESDTVALAAIMQKAIGRGAEIASYGDFDSFHRNPAQIAWNRLN